MSRKPKPSSLPPLAPDAATKQAQPLLAFPTTTAVRLILESTDVTAVEAATAELKARLGRRFAVAKRLPAPRNEALRISGTLIMLPDDARGGVDTGRVQE
jgi:hypothetical protein